MFLTFISTTSSFSSFVSEIFSTLTIFPLSSTATLSHINCISDNICDDTNTATPSLCDISFNISLNFLIPAGSRPFVGSSSINTFGLCNKVNAKPNLCFIPKEYLPTLSFSLPFSSTNSKTSLILFSSIFLILACNLKLSIPDIYLYKSGFSTIAPIHSIAFSNCFLVSYPFTLISPESLFISLKIILIVVVFPEPFGPKKPYISPSSTSKLRLSIIFLFPNDLLTFFNSNTFFPILSQLHTIFIISSSIIKL